MPHILVDGAQFFNKRGTGIASYARTLVSTFESMGCRVSVLYGRQVERRRRSSPLSLANQVFGERPPKNAAERIFDQLSRVSAPLLPGALSAKAEPIATTGVNLRAIDPPLPNAGNILNSDRVYERSAYLFGVKQRLTEVSIPSDIDVAHWTGPLAVKAKNVPNVYTIHDLIPLQFPYFVYDKSGRNALLHAAIAREADLIITVSEASKRAIVDLLSVPEERVHVTYQPVPPIFSLPLEDAERLVHDVYGVKAGDYALFVGALEPKKNLRRLMEAHILANPGIPLLMVGPLGWMYGDQLELLEALTRNEQPQRNLESSDRLVSALSGALANAQPPAGPASTASVRYLGFLPRRHVAALLQCARFFAFPSICEGFGLPVLEAMQAGTPVLTSNTTSLPEVAGDAAVLVDPFDVADMARGITQIANDADLRRDLVKRGRRQVERFGAIAYKERLAAAYNGIGIALPVPGRQTQLVAATQHNELSQCDGNIAGSLLARNG